MLGECKWRNRPVERQVLHKLVSNTREIVPKQGQWHVLYLGFARGGWTPAAQAFAQTTSALAVPDGANWQPAGMVLLDLPQVDRDLHQ